MSKSITMPADSTQQSYFDKKKMSVSSISSLSSDTDESQSSSSSSTSSSSSSSKISKQKLKKRNLKKRKKRVKADSDYEDDLDLSKEIFPISGYIKNKELMVENMFKSISKKKLKAMLPNILKTVPFNKLKRMCLEQLQVMSNKRICRTLTGQDPELISSSGTDEVTDVDLNQFENTLLNSIEDSLRNTNQAVSILNDDILNTNPNDKNVEIEHKTEDLSQDNSPSNKSNEKEFKYISEESNPDSLPSLLSEPEEMMEFGSNDEIFPEPNSKLNNDDITVIKITENEMLNTENSKSISSTNIISGELNKPILNIEESTNMNDEKMQLNENEECNVKISTDHLSEDLNNEMIMKIDECEYMNNIDEDIEIDNNERFLVLEDANLKGRILDEADDAKIEEEVHLEKKSSKTENKSQLEILELEMRARAIKAMLKAQEDINIKEDISHMNSVENMNDTKHVTLNTEDTFVNDDKIQISQNNLHTINSSREVHYDLSHNNIQVKITSDIVNNTKR